MNRLSKTTTLEKVIAVEVYDEYGTFITEYSSINRAKLYTGVAVKTIAKHIRAKTEKVFTSKMLKKRIYFKAKDI